MEHSKALNQKNIDDVDFQVVSSNTQGNSTIYNSVAQKLRKERGQNLDAFIHTFMQSIEQSSNTDIGEDVIMMKEIDSEHERPQPPGHNSIFGNLFGLGPATAHHNHASFGVRQHPAKGPSQCLIYIREWNQLIVRSIRILESLIY